MFNQESLQMLSMIMDKNRSENQQEAQMGFQENMANLDRSFAATQSSLEDSRRQREINSERISRLQETLSMSGVDVNAFSDSNLSDMGKRIEGSLQSQDKILGDIIDMQSQELSSLRNAQFSFGSGFNTGRNLLNTIEFDDDLQVKAGSIVDRLINASGNTDEIVRILNEHDITDVGTDPRSQQAFVAGLSQTIGDISSKLNDEKMRADLRLARRNDIRAQLADDEARFNNRLDMANKLVDDPAQLISVEAMALANPDLSKSERRNHEQHISQVLSSGAESFTNDLFEELTKDIEDQETLDKLNKIFSQFGQSYAELSFDIVNGIATNPSRYISSLSKSMMEFERVHEEGGDIMQAIANGEISPDDFANVMAFVGNPFVSPTLAGGFRAAQDILNNERARKHLRSGGVPGLAKAEDALGTSWFSEGFADKFRTILTDSHFGDSVNLQNPSESLSQDEIDSLARDGMTQRQIERQIESRESAVDSESSRQSSDARQEIERLLLILRSGTLSPGEASSSQRKIYELSKKIEQNRDREISQINRGRRGTMPGMRVPSRSTVDHNILENNPLYQRIIQMQGELETE